MKKSNGKAVHVTIHFYKCSGDFVRSHDHSDFPTGGISFVPLITWKVNDWRICLLPLISQSYENLQHRNKLGFKCTVINQLTWLYDKLNDIESDFDLFSGPKIASMRVLELHNAAADLVLKYNEEHNVIAILSEIWSFKMHGTTILCNINSSSSMKLLKIIHL